jgi:hypothetical protein
LGGVVLLVFLVAFFSALAGKDFLALPPYGGAFQKSVPTLKNTLSCIREPPHQIAMVTFPSLPDTRFLPQDG